MKFSERTGKKSIKSELQVESIDMDLKNRLWNTILEDFFEKIPHYDRSSYKNKNEEEVHKFIWKEFFKKAIDQIPINKFNGDIYIEGCVGSIRFWFFGCEWFEIYDFIEFLLTIGFSLNLNMETLFNKDLEKEISGYRIINKKVTQITSPNEVEEIEQALENSTNWKSVNTHLFTALNFLADRKSPEYRNSIKESISAVEAICKIITNDPNATLGKALSEIEKTHKLHNALKSSFSSLYGFTSDSSGIRHSLLENSSDVSFADAKFMLVSCSAFINYLKSKMGT